MLGLESATTVKSLLALVVAGVVASCLVASSWALTALKMALDRGMLVVSVLLELAEAAFSELEELVWAELAFSELVELDSLLELVFAEETELEAVLTELFALSSAEDCKLEL